MEKIWVSTGAFQFLSWNEILELKGKGHEPSQVEIPSARAMAQHTTYSWDIMCQKWEGDCGLWVLNEMIKKINTESLKKIVGAVWELPAK